MNGNCNSFAADETVAAAGGACGVPVCTECLWHDDCHEQRLPDGVLRIWRRAMEEADQKGIANTRIEEMRATLGVEVQLP